MGSPELISQIALRLPPSEPQHLVRASLISKTWCRELTGPVFRKAYTLKYPNPPLLGYFSSCNPKFVPLCPLSPCRSPARSTATWHILDCRNGTVLVHRTDAQLSAEEPYRLLISNPVTGDQELLPLPPCDYQFFAGAILCGSPDCGHVQCASFLVVFVGCNEDEDDEDQNVVWESTYSSATGEWSSSVKLQRPRGDYRNHRVEMV